MRTIATLLALAAALALVPAALGASSPARADRAQWEWPVPMPHWYWRWALWREHGRVYPRPASAPRDIPGWAWRRLTAQMNVGVEQRLRNFTRDLLQQRWGATGVHVGQVVRSDSNKGWFRVSGTYSTPEHRIWAGWFVMRLHRHDRWYLAYMGIGRSSVQPDPLALRDHIPCDIRPAFATPRC